MVHDVDVVADPAARLSRLEGDYPLGERAMVEAPVDGVGRPGAPAEVRVEAREQTRVEVSVRGDADGLLVLGDPGTRSGGSRSTAGRPSCSGSTTPSAACASPPATTGSSSPTRTAPSRPAWPSAP